MRVFLLAFVLMGAVVGSSWAQRDSEPLSVEVTLRWPMQSEMISNKYVVPGTIYYGATLPITTNKGDRLILTISPKVSQTNSSVEAAENKGVFGDFRVMLTDPRAFSGETPVIVFDATFPLVLDKDIPVLQAPDLTISIRLKKGGVEAPVATP